MPSFPYMSNPAKIKQFLEHVQSASIPPKVTQNYLLSAGYKSKNDQPLINIMKFVGFLDSSGVPTSVWQDYRAKTRATAVLAKAIQTSYVDLFAMYPDAFRKDDEALRNYFTSKTNVGKSTINYIVLTFKNLCKLADDFEAVSVEDAVPEPVISLAEEATRIPTSTPGLTVNINIQLTLPATDDETVYDRLFASLKRNLLS